MPKTGAVDTKKFSKRAQSIPNNVRKLLTKFPFKNHHTCCFLYEKKYYYYCYYYYHFLISSLGWYQKNNNIRKQP